MSGLPMGSLKTIRAERGLSIEGLARMSGLSARTIYRVEKGLNPSPATVERLREALQLPSIDGSALSCAGRPPNGGTVSDGDVA